MNGAVHTRAQPAFRMPQLQAASTPPPRVAVAGAGRSRKSGVAPRDQMSDVRSQRQRDLSFWFAASDRLRTCRARRGSPSDLLYSEGECEQETSAAQNQQSDVLFYNPIVRATKFSPSTINRTLFSRSSFYSAAPAALLASTGYCMSAFRKCLFGNRSGKGKSRK